MNSYNVCIGCGWVYESSGANVAAISRHLRETGHPGTVGTTSKRLADEWSARYRAEAEGLGSSVSKETK